MNRCWIVTSMMVAWSVQAADLPAQPGTAAAPVQPHAPSIESPGYVWNDVKGEQLLALEATGDATRGAYAFKVCKDCHGGDALGDAAGFYPRLAGQHATVLVKQLADIRAGRRDNPKMYPYASEHSISSEQIADIAAYLNGLPVPPEHGQGPGGDLALGERLYKADCASCHGRTGEGKADEFYPKLSDQHYAYLLRQTYEIRDGVRRNAQPDMVDAVKPYSDAEIIAVIDYVSRFPTKDNSGTLQQKR
ncbi:c-type cytochrome [Thiohalocapsa marina]|uniref:C-type cytochrome n=1 Tax=Thiohalocapsa marina TaxID=424902 RepID=A0A5M8FAB2_9GAMM|nr:c-type cytochrome [Thiohalocapsa marina]KAA6181773.1 c-type cytochrome [Thiohalocapsa marina]